VAGAQSARLTMVFSTTTLFKGVPCPEGEKCRLTSCIFAHDLRPQAAPAPSVAASQNARVTSNPEKRDSEPPAKRQRVTYAKAEDKPPSRADLIRNQLAKDKTQKATSATSSLKPEVAKPTPPSLTRAVSPPAKTNGKATLTTGATKGANVKSMTTVQPPLKVTLNPRLIPNDPAGHAKRSQLLKLLHGEMARLNKAVIERSKTVQFRPGLILHENEIIQIAVEEEAGFASTKGNVYGNVIKNRIGAYRKMMADDWIVHLKTTPLFKSKNAPPPRHPGQPDPPKAIETGLSPQEEVAVLSHLVVKDQKPLAQFGYVPTPPTPEQAAEAAAAVEASKNYEICDRCSARFQVFPNRNEEGLLTSNGPCRHHPNRKVFPQRTKADTGPKEPYYPCCNEVVGTVGCTTTAHHVYKASAPARMAAVLPFVTTPENEQLGKDRQGNKVGAVAFDCEMGYTTLGLELIRLTAISWPQGEELLDVLVRPLGIVLDLNSRFSGVFPEDIANAVPYDAYSTPKPPPPPPPAQLDGSASPPPPPPLPIVDSPQKARELLCSFLTPTTPLLGHAIENDLNAVRLCHQTIIDTVIIFPHPRGLPLRYGLRMLSAKHLGRQIQQGGERGHDSLEDAQATGDLVRVKVGEKWKLLRATGWTLVKGQLVPPPPPREGELEARRDSDGVLTEDMVERAMNGGAKRRKRKLSAEEKQEGNGLKSFLERGGDGRAIGGGEAVGEGGLSATYLEDG